MPFKEVYGRILHNAGVSPSAATACVEVNVVVTPWNMSLEIARVARRTFRPEPKGRGISDHVELLPERNAHRVVIRCRRQPSGGFSINPDPVFCFTQINGTANDTFGIYHDSLYLARDSCNLVNNIRSTIQRPVGYQSRYKLEAWQREIFPVGFITDGAIGKAAERRDVGEILAKYFYAVDIDGDSVIVFELQQKVQEFRRIRDVDGSAEIGRQVFRQGIRAKANNLPGPFPSPPYPSSDGPDFQPESSKSCDRQAVP